MQRHRRRRRNLSTREMPGDSDRKQEGRDEREVTALDRTYINIDGLI